MNTNQAKKQKRPYYSLYSFWWKNKRLLIMPEFYQASRFSYQFTEKHRVLRTQLN